MTIDPRRGAALAALAVACAGAPPPATRAPATRAPATTAPPAVAAAPCPSVIGGSVHDLDADDAPVAGATVLVGRTDERPTLTDDAGRFLVEDVAQPAQRVTVYVADVTAVGRLPACVDHLLWLGVHGRDASAAATALVVRQEAGAVDLDAVQRAARHRETLAAAWLTFYEAFGAVVAQHGGDCAQLAGALDGFVAQQRAAIDAIRAQRAAMSSDDRSRLDDTLARKYAARTAAVQQQLGGIVGCQDDAHVRRALTAIPR